jgi:hypothetical protein
MKKQNQEEYINRSSNTEDSAEISERATPDENEIKKTREYYEKLIPLGEILFGRWGYTIAVDPNIPTFAFDHEKKQVIISPNLDRRIETDLQKTFVFCHEIGHMVQLFQNPEQYLETFEDSRKRGEQIGEELGEDARQFAEQAWRMFYNAFLDIHSNSIVRERIPTLQTAKGKTETSELYGKMVSGDLSEYSLSEQFLFSLLRSVMIPGAETKVSDEISKIIDSPISYLGRNFSSMKEACRELIFSGDLDLQGALFRIKKLFASEFERLVKEDIKAGRKNPGKNSVESGSNSGKPGSNSGESGSNPSDLMDKNPSEEDIKKIVEGHKKAQASSADKTKSIVDKMIEDRGKEAGLSGQEIERMKEIVRSVGDTYESMVEVWERFFSISMDLDIVRESGYLSGQNVSVSRLVRDLPTVLSHPSEARIFERGILKESKESIRPKKLSLYLILDLSGSMTTERRERVQESTYAIAKSLVQFKRRLAVENEDLASLIAINLRIIGFGSTYAELLDRLPEEQENREIEEETIDLRLWRAIFKINNDLGGTSDDAPLMSTLEDVQKERALLDEDKETAVVIEITDGKTATPDQSSVILEELGKIKNVHCRGIQIGDGYSISDEESEEVGGKRSPMIFEPTGTFERVWKKQGKKLPNISDLKKVFVDLLSEVLRKD